MEFSTVIEFIQTLGFPIACVCAMFYMYNKIEDRHREEVDKLTEALNNNTLALTEIKAYLYNREEE